MDLGAWENVLEPVPDARKAIVEIFRIPKLGGRALRPVPHVERAGARPTDEGHEITDPKEGIEGLGQRDHLGRYGWDYVDQLCEVGFAVNLDGPDRTFNKRHSSQYRLRKLGFLRPISIAAKTNW